MGYLKCTSLKSIPSLSEILLSFDFVLKPSLSLIYGSRSRTSNTFLPTTLAWLIAVIYGTNWISLIIGVRRA